MTKRLAFLATIVLSMMIGAPPIAADAGGADAGGNEDGDRHGWRYGPYASGSPDSGTCGNSWADDTFKRVFRVTQRPDGTWYVREDFKNGKFTTVAGASPGACQPGADHGTFVAAGIKGEFKGWLAGTVTGGTFDPSGGCPAPCTGTTFIARHFGAGATWNVIPFKFTYHAEGKDLLYRAWQNASADQGGNRGDIASP